MPNDTTGLPTFPQKFMLLYAGSSIITSSLSKYMSFMLCCIHAVLYRIHAVLCRTCVMLCAVNRARCGGRVV